MALFEFSFDLSEGAVSDSTIKQVLAEQGFALIHWEYPTQKRLQILLEKPLTSYSEGRKLADVVLNLLPEGSVVAGCRQSARIEDMSEADLQELMDALENKQETL